jgi:phosphoenolpyruvate synthase/pyruvate phosphate dikinase
MSKINPQRELFNWGPIDFKVFYGSFFTEVFWFELQKHYPWSWPPFYFFHKNGTALFIGDYEDLRDTGEKYFKKYFLNFENYQKHWDLWEDWVLEFKKITKKYSEINFSKLDKKQLLETYKEFYDLNIRFWLIVQVPEVANWGGERMLKNILEKIDKEKINEYLEIFSAPVKYSFFQEEELDLLRIVLKSPLIPLFQRGKSDSLPFKKGELERDLQSHAQKYCWLLNSYGGNRILATKFFENKLKELLKEGNARDLIKKIQNKNRLNKTRKIKLAKDLGLSKDIVFMTDQLSESIWWQDLRKSYIWRSHYFWDKILHGIEKKTNWSFDELLWCWPREVKKILEGKKIDKNKILERKKFYTVYLGNGKMKEYYGKAARELMKKYEVKNDDEVKEIKGLVVSKGNGKAIQGRVKIIKNPFKELKKMQEGNILVAGMTSPEFIVAMRKAAAIITDHGGMTSHAAIVSRELDIPCIVNTKIATKVLKDGDIVEVDTKKGVVKKIVLK